jgi:subtilisin-like proprotein convertase family protein
VLPSTIPIDNLPVVGGSPQEQHVAPTRAQSLESGPMATRMVACLRSIVAVSLVVGALAGCGSAGGGSGGDSGGVPFDVPAVDVGVDGGTIPGTDVPRPDAKDVGSGADLTACQQEGTFGCPCAQNSDCQSGYCVEELDGFVCTTTCLTDCPDGYSCKAVLNTLPDVVFICVPDVARLCQPCRSDLQCSGGLCVEYEDGGYCASPCPHGAADCPATYACQEVPVNGVTTPVCLPRTGSCSCRTGTAGQLRACQVANAAGTCSGYETCDPAAGWVDCDAATPAEEVCNGVDDDCDGRPDDGLGERPCAIENAAGRCEGVEVCTGTGGWVCSARTPAEEVCDYVDNDCDGVTDDPFVEDGAYVTDEHCGACNVPCANSIPNATAIVCDDQRELPQCIVGACAPGFVRLNDFQCIIPPSALCQPCRDDAACYGGWCRDIAGADYCTRSCGAEDDEDCPDGFVCAAHPETGEDVCLPQNGSCDCTAETEGARRSCSVENAFGTCFGFQRCQAGTGWGACDASTPAPEVCNGVDDDCNGLADDDVPVGVPCTRDNAHGSCPGTTVCYGPAGEQCNAPLAAPELCDYVDNDCDGVTDNGFPDLYRSCTAGEGACQRFGFFRCTEGGLGTACSVVAGAGTPEVCNGVDDDCNGQTDEDWPGRGSICAVGRGACARAGVQVCDPANPAGPVVCDAQPGVPGEELCNGADDDCDGQTDEGLAGALCPVQAGVCAGATETCRGALGWQPCTPATYIAHDAAWEVREVSCDGRDNDCDGQTDEELPAQLCPEQRGVCAGATTPCVGGQWTACGAASYGAGYEAVETRCDLLDNDCDGQTDEGWQTGGVYARNDACGNCFTDCTRIYDRPQAFGVCQSAGGARCVMVCDADWFDLNAVPDDGCEFLLDADAIYVSVDDPLANDLPGCGRGPTQTGGGNRPCRTIGAALGEAQSSGRGKVLVADGLYEEVVRLVAGIDVLGGHRADTWERHVDSSLTVLRGNDTATHKSTVIASGISLATTLEGFVLYGPVNPTVGGNSYGVYVANSSANLRIVNNTIYGGAGGPGAGQTAAGAGAAGGAGAGRSPCTASGARSPNLAIPDNNATGVSDTLTLSGTCDFAHVAVGLNITHTYIGDLIITVRNPAGTTVTLWDRAGGSQDDLILTLNVPELATGGVAGSWVLTVADRASGDTGRLVSWDLTVSGDRAYDAFVTPAHPCTSASNRSYGNGGAGTCGGASVAGGAGGGNVCPPVFDAEGSGRDGGAGASVAGGGAGGGGGDAGDDGRVELASPFSCILPGNPMSGADGANGAAGAAGVAGAGCAAPQGSISGSHWLGGAGAPGVAGRHGGGGGGGGAGGGGLCNGGVGCNGRDRLGGHGGGGGAGGCGGGGGAGGGAGGGSFAIFVVGGGAPTIQGNTIFQGSGGEGGAGGNGGTGGVGGNGGAGGRCNGDCWCFDSAGKGGEGGAGGHGGGGGGGCGGGSFGIYTAGLGAAPDYCAAAAGNSISGGVAGAAGAGGLSLGNSGTAGTVGRLQACSPN